MTHLRPRRLTLTTVALLLAVVLLVPAAARAADTTITFDGLPEGSAITNQYAAQGVLFGDAAAFGFGELYDGCSPNAPAARSGTASLGFCGGAAEFPNYASMGAFSSFRSKVSMKVISGNGADDLTEDVTLRVYDVRRNQIATASVPISAAGRTLSISLGTPQIAFFTLQRDGIYPTSPRFDDFTFDNPPVPPDPHIAIGIDNGGYARLRQGGTADVTVRILRFNGSNGNVNLSADGLPGDVSAAFTPNPAGGSSFLTTATLKLTAQSYASAGHFTPTVTANPAASAGDSADSAGFAVDVVPPFRLSAQSTASVSPCTPTSMPFALEVEPGYTDPIDISITHSSGTVDATLPARFTPGFSDPIKTLALSAAPGTGKSADDRLTITASSGSFTRVATIDVDRNAGALDGVKVAVVADVNAGPVVAPRLGQPGTYLRVLGRGLCPDSRIFFGPGDSKGAPLENRAADGRSANVRVPFTATDGNPTLSNPDSDGHSAGTITFGRALTVATYRNTMGFSFANFKSDGPNWGDIVRLYGKDQTTIEVDPCGAVTFGIADCGVSTGIPRPEVAIYYAAVAGYGEKGNCYGLDLASYRLWASKRSMADFAPAGATWPFQLDGPSGAAGELRYYVRQMMLAQSASETMLIRAASVGRQSPGTLFQAIQGALDKGHPAMMSLRQGDSGHAVLAYGLTPTPNGYDIETYNPNSPHMPTEDANSGTHDGALEKSRIHVNINGTWSFPGLSWSGGFDKIGAYDIDAIPQNLSPPTGVADVLIAIMYPDATAISEVTDAAGKPIPGAVQLASETGDEPGPLTDVIPRGHTLRAPLKGGGGTLALFGRNHAFQLAGTAKTLTMDAGGTTIGAQGAAKGLTLTTTSTSGGATRAATARYAAGGDAAIGLGAGGALTVRGSGAVALTLGQVAKRGTGSLTLNGLRLRRGETATVRPGSWSKAGSARVSVRGKGGALRRLTLRTKAGGGATVVRSLKLKARGAQITATAKLRLPAATVPASATLTWQVRKGSRTVRKGALTLSAAQLADLGAGRGVPFTIKASKGSYAVRASLVVGVTAKGRVLPAISAKRASTRVTIG
ncbi:hypothetical protein [Baekduia sp.]|jgi:hypothetical protein|uniref:hypothetical protein n=1 Tax=Baekduia sp. TaxID=2600305 RepID=UPI002E0A038F|nr:hypothetical protein [Baekduia sp.]